MNQKPVLKLKDDECPFYQSGYCCKKLPRVKLNNLPECLYLKRNVHKCRKLILWKANNDYQ